MTYTYTHSSVSLSQSTLTKAATFFCYLPPTNNPGCRCVLAISPSWQGSLHRAVFLTFSKSQQDQRSNAGQRGGEQQDAATAVPVHGQAQEEAGQACTAGRQQIGEVELSAWTLQGSPGWLVTVADGVGDETARGQRHEQGRGEQAGEMGVILLEGWHQFQNGGPLIQEPLIVSSSPNSYGAKFETRDQGVHCETLNMLTRQGGNPSRHSPTISREALDSNHGPEEAYCWRSTMFDPYWDLHGYGQSICVCLPFIPAGRSLGIHACPIGQPLVWGLGFRLPSLIHG